MSLKSSELSHDDDDNEIRGVAVYSTEILASDWETNKHPSHGMQFVLFLCSICFPHSNKFKSAGKQTSSNAFSAYQLQAQRDNNKDSADKERWTHLRQI